MTFIHSTVVVATLVGAGALGGTAGPQDPSARTVAAQVSPGPSIVIGHELSMTSEALGRAITLDVYVPPSYGTGQGRYPVLYTFQSFFHHVSGIADYLANINATPELIVVSVRNYSSSDLSPETLPSNPESGGANRFVRFFAEELLPLVDARYRTAPYRLLYSGSFGGGFVVYCALVRPETFNAYLAATPAIDYEGQSTFIATHAESWLRRGTFRNRYLFMAVEDDPALAKTMTPFAALLQRAAPAGLTWEYRHWPEEDHGTLPHRVVLHGLNRVFDKWRRIPAEAVSTGAAGIRAYAKELADWYGFDIGLSRQALFAAVNEPLRRGDVSAALGIAEYLVERHPREEFDHRLLGRTYESAGRLEEALKAYERAYALAVENASPHLDLFRASLEAIRKKIQLRDGWHGGA